MVALNFYSLMLLSLTCLIYECLSIKYRSFQDISNVDTITSRLAKAVANVGKTHFKENGPTLLLVPSKNDKLIILDIFERLLQHMSRFVSILTLDDLPHGVTAQHMSFLVKSREIKVLQKPNIYIIPIKEYNGFQGLDSVMKTLNLFESFNPRSIFILVKTIVECGKFNEYNESSRLFARLWKTNCMAVALVVFSECDLQLTVISGNPFSKENPCRTPASDGLRYNHFIPSDDFIAIDIPKPKIRNFNGCLFTAGTIPAPPFVVAKEVRIEDETQYSFVGGLEMELKDMMSKKFNVTVKLDVSNGYDVHSILRRFSNGTEVGIATDMKNHKIDFALGGVSPNYRTFYMFDFSNTYVFSSFSWYVANANIAPRWQLIFKTLSLDVWISSAAFFVLVSSLYFVMELHNYKRRKTSKFSVTSITFIEIFCVGLGLSATQQPIGCVKVLFFSWAAFGLHWSMAYSSTLFDLLRTPPLEKEILTIQDLRDSGIQVVSPPLYFQLFKGVNIDSVTRSVLSNKIECMNLNVCIKEFVANRNVSLMDRTEHVDFSVNYKLSKIHKLSENLISFGVSLMANKGNPLSHAINEVVSLAFETGLVGKWETETGWKYNYEKNTLESYSEDSDDSSLPLSVTVLQGAFLLLIVGLVISVLAFLVELYIFNCKQ